MHVTVKTLENQALLEKKGDGVNNTPWSTAFGTLCCREQVRHTGAGQTHAPAGEASTDHIAQCGRQRDPPLNEQTGVTWEWLSLQLCLMNAAWPAIWSCWLMKLR